MIIVADESVDFGIVEALRDEGFEVWSIMETSPSISDTDVLSIAFEKEAFLITEDKDFGELTYRLQKLNHGILLIRLSGLSSAEKSNMVANVIKNQSEELMNSFSVLTYNNLRIKKKQ